jgi:ABC-type glycerol-3-phosphate transport system substrate-binding protein
VTSPHAQFESTPHFGPNQSVQPAMILLTNFAQWVPRLVDGARQCLSDPDVRVAPLPGSRPGVYFGHYRINLAVRKSSPEQEAASWEFVKWMCRKDISAPDFWFGYPCRKDFIERDDLQAYWDQGCQNYEGVFRVMEGSTIQSFQSHPISIQTMPTIIGQYLQGGASLDATVAALQASAGELFFPHATSVDRAKLFR